MTMTYRAVQEELRAAGFVMSKKGETHRINFFSGLEDTAHYTTSFNGCPEPGAGDVETPAPISRAGRAFRQR